MPDDLRAEVQKAANKKGWSLTQELLWRVRSSYKRQREEERRPPATRALCFLISEIAERVGYYNPSKWHRSTFAFRAFRLAVGQLLETLEPTGDMKNPYRGLSEAFRQIGSPSMAEVIALNTETPESVGAHAAKTLVDELLYPRPGLEAQWRQLVDHPEVGRLAEGMLDTLYGVAHARRDLGIQLGDPDKQL
jgi:hypothetical protein